MHAENQGAESNNTRFGTNKQQQKQDSYPAPSVSRIFDLG